MAGKNVHNAFFTVDLSYYYLEIIKNKGTIVKIDFLEEEEPKYSSIGMSPLVIYDIFTNMKSKRKNGFLVLNYVSNYKFTLLDEPPLLCNTTFYLGMQPSTFINDLETHISHDAENNQFLSVIKNTIPNLTKRAAITEKVFKALAFKLSFFNTLNPVRQIEILRTEVFKHHGYKVINLKDWD
jgi:hypothetical protein